MPAINLTGNGAGGPGGASPTPASTPAGTATASGSGGAGGPIPAGYQIFNAQSTVGMLSRIEGVLRTQVGLLQSIASSTRATYIAVGQIQAGVGTGTGPGPPVATPVGAPGGAPSPRRASSAASSFNAYRQSGLSNVAGMAGGYSGFGALGGLGLSRALENPYALGAAALGVAFFAPQLTGAVNSAFLGNTDVYRNQMMGAYGAARAGGFSGSGLYDALNPAVGSISRQMMMNLGMTPQSALSSLQQYGISPNSAGQGSAMAMSLGQVGQSPGTYSLAGLDNGSLIVSARQFGAYGRDVNGNTQTNSDRGVDQYFVKLGTVMTQATALGLDKSQVLNSVNASMSSMAGMGGSNLNNTTAYLSRYMSSGTAGGRDGSLAAAGAATLQNQANNPFGTSFSGAMFMSGAMRAKTSSQLSNMIGSDTYNTLMASPSGRQQVADFLNPSTQPAIKAQILAQMVGGNPNAQIALNQSYINSLGINGAAGRAVLGGQIGYAQSYIQSTAGQQGNPIGPGSTSTGRSIGANFDPTNTDYASQLSAMGVPAQYIPQLIADAKKYNMNPILVGAKMMTESGGVADGPAVWAKDKNGVKTGTYSQGLMQLDSNTFSNPAGMTWQQNLDAGTGYFANLVNANGGDVDKGDMAYRGNTDMNDPATANYYNRETAFIQRSGATGGGAASVPIAVNQANSAGGFQSLDASATTFGQFSGAVITFNSASNKFSGAVDKWVSNNAGAPGGPRASRQRASVTDPSVYAP